MLQTSKEKNRLARVFVKEISHRFPKAMASKVDGVFVFGSTASNLALPKSDLDIFILVEKNADKFSQSFEGFRTIFAEKHGINLNLQFYHTRDFNSFLETRTASNFGLEKLLLDGCLPIYLNKIKYPISKRKELIERIRPSRQTIIDRYVTGKRSAEHTNTLSKRLEQRKTRAGNKRFIP